MGLNNQGFPKLLHICELLYLFLTVSSFYLLFLSRAGEVHTVWEVLHPAFIPTLFIATSLLFTILLTSEKVAYKLVFIIVHSILIHSLFSIIFPAGDLSGQQMTLGRTRLVYDNAIIQGWPPGPAETIQSQIYEWFRGIDFQAALSVIFARMLSLDIFWVHLFLVPVLWGVFTPIAAYLTTYTLTKNEKVAVLASLFLSAFPYATYFGAISVTNSLGYIFFFYSLLFMLKSLDSNDSKTTFLMLIFSFLSILSHNLTGIMSLSLLILTLAFKSYKSEKSSPTTARVSLLTSFIFCASLLPLSLTYLRFFRPKTYTAFTFNKFYELPFQEIIGLFFIGELTSGFKIETILIVIIGPALALPYMIYLLRRSEKSSSTEFRVHLLFLLAAFLIMLVDYRILKLFMEDLPFNEERLWVFRDFIAAPFIALAIYEIVLKAFHKRSFRRLLNLGFTLNFLFSLVVGGWITFSLRAAYPQAAPLQTTWYELEAVTYIEENTNEKYVVIGDTWTIFAGERIVGITNPGAYYFAEFDRTGLELFFNMAQDPSPQWMIQAMDYTNTTVAYFIITKPRLPVGEFVDIVSRVLRNPQITVVEVFGEEKLYVFSYRRGENV